MSRAPVRHRRIDRKRGDNVIDIEYSIDIYIVCRPKAKWKERKSLVMLNLGATEHNSSLVFLYLIYLVQVGLICPEYVRMLLSPVARIWWGSGVWEVEPLSRSDALSTALAWARPTS